MTCKHRQCAICLKRTCHEGITLSERGGMRVCSHCIDRAVKLSLAMARTYGSTYKDECGFESKTDSPTSGSGKVASSAMLGLSSWDCRLHRELAQCSGAIAKREDIADEKKKGKKVNFQIHFQG